MALAPEREIFLRTGGKVRFLRISTRVQLLVVGAIAMLLGGWAAATGAMLWNQAHISIERASLAQRRQAVRSQEAQVNSYRHSIDDIASDIEERQKALEDIIRTNLGAAPAAGNPVIDATGAKAGAADTHAAPAKTIGDAAHEIERLERLQRQQKQIEAQVAQAAQARLDKVEKAIRSFGLNPDRLSSEGAAQGGPYLPVHGLIADDPELRDLASLLGRLNSMEMTLAAIPSALPTATPMESSSYGYRRDPFNGHIAFHAGIDFPGSFGQLIHAAARGRVSFVGRRSGYGNVVEINHGNGILTRYAHLSGFVAHVGDKVVRGQTIARMGSTGRSTGTHLHFEVRVRGAAVNPRPFLEARQDVLEVQQLAKEHAVRSSDRG